ncbi:MAG: hypothetical protein EX271_09895, partial [Acidimicrobiales bacterium]
MPLIFVRSSASAFLAAGFLAGAFLAAGFFASAFGAASFLGAAFFAAGFFAAGFFSTLSAFATRSGRPSTIVTEPLAFSTILIAPAVAPATFKLTPADSFPEPIKRIPSWARR